MRKLVWRFLAARKLRTALSLISVALGVAFMVALLTLNAAMDRAVDAQLSKLVGNFDLMAGYRTPDTRLSSADLSEMARLPGVTNVAGVLIPYMYEAHPELPPDLMYYGPESTPLGREFRPIAEGRFPGPGEMAVSPAWAKKHGYQIGDTVRLAFPPGGEQPVRISGLIAIDKGVGFGIFDHAWLEHVTGRTGSTFVLISVARGADVDRLAAGIQAAFPKADVDVAKFKSDLRRNLNALRPLALGLGVAALLSAAFLLAASFRMALAERARELAMLRAVGATPEQVRRLVLAEGLLLGLAGSVTGAALGVGAAVLAAGGVARMLQVEQVDAVIPWGQAALTVLGGVALTMLSAWGVARSAGQTEPLRAMRPDLPAQERSARQGGWFGLGLAAAGAVLAAIGPSLPEAPLDGGLPPLVTSTGALAVALGLVLGVQRILPLLLPLLTYPLRRRPLGILASRSLLRNRRRSGLTVGAMGLGLILVIAIGTLSTSLVEGWYQDVKQQHPTDVQVEVPQVYTRGVPGDLLQRVAAIPGVTQVAAVYDGGQALLVDGNQPLWLSPADLPGLVQAGAYQLTAGAPDGWGAGTIALRSDYAERLGARVGDRLKLNVRQGIVRERQANPDIREYTVNAIYAADSWKLPFALIGEQLPGMPGTLRMLYANAAPAQLESVRSQVRELVQAMEYSIADYSDYASATAELRGALNQRLALVLAVGLITAAVAAMSLINTLVGSMHERRREFALLRSVGATPGQVQAQVALEAVLLGLVGGLVGVAGGAVLGFGALRGLGMAAGAIRLPWALMAGGLAVSLLLAVVAAAGPARRGARIAAAEAVRSE